MKPSKSINKSTEEKIVLFRSFFKGLSHKYGLRDPASGNQFQVKKPVTDQVILDHLKGKRHFGVYLLNGWKTNAVVADFDTPDRYQPVLFVNSARHYQLNAYIEKSKSKGFHVWIFFESAGVPAIKARMVAKLILEEIDSPDVEIFPKQDCLKGQNSSGNYILTPLFGKLVIQDRTVFINPTTFKPFPDQWCFLTEVKKVSESVLDDIIEINDLEIRQKNNQESSISTSQKSSNNRFSLPPCAQKMLQDGVSGFQRVSCFRLAVHLKRLGLPLDIAIVTLNTWRKKNRPSDGKQIIEESEIVSQASYAYVKDYRGFGCDSEAVRPFCRPDCPLNIRLKQQH